MLRRQATLLLCAVQFLTRLPVPAIEPFEPEWITRSARWFPLVGQVIGAICAVVLVGAAQVWSGWIAALLAIGAGVLITGALHEDGLADSADGLFGGVTPARRLEIMRDSRVGVFGALALMFVLALKVAALAGVQPMRGALLLVAAHGTARAAVAMVMWLTPYATAAGATKWTPAARGVSASEAAVAALIALWPLFLLPPVVALSALVGGALPALCLAVLANRRLGGHSGDVLGGAEQLFETGFLIGAVAMVG
jgi:adenosylcobinamide-GDP ribazoletransferase